MDDINEFEGAILAAGRGIAAPFSESYPKPHPPTAQTADRTPDRDDEKMGIRDITVLIVISVSSFKGAR